MSRSLRQLTEDDAAAFRDLRLAGLQESPTAFGSSYAAEKDRSLDEFAATIAKNYLVGAFLDGCLAGVAGFYQLSGEKTAHRGQIWGDYVDPPHRGQGIARALIENILARAKGIVSQVHLCVVTGNDAALHLYESFGFQIYGTEPDALRVDGTSYDEHLMVWRAI